MSAREELAEILSDGAGICYTAEHLADLITRAVAEAVEASRKDVKEPGILIGKEFDEIYTATDSGADYEADEKDYAFMASKGFPVGYFVPEEQQKLVKEVRAAAKDAAAITAELDRVNERLAELGREVQELHQRQSDLSWSDESTEKFRRLHAAQKALAEYLAK